MTCNGGVIADGDGTAVLDGPVQALAHLVDMLARQPPLPAPLQLKAGSIVTTGSLTDAQPLLPGQHWQTGIASAASPEIARTTLSGPLVDLRLLT
jgi:2-oxo-3-hexenedioate decarboxylase